MKDNVKEFKITQFPQVRGSKIWWHICYYQCLISYASYIGRDYTMMFADMLQCEYDNNVEKEVSFIEKMKINTNILSNLENYCGIYQNVVRDGLPKAEELDFSNNKMYITFVDIYDCYWGISYKERHNQYHNIILYKAEKDKYVALDPSVNYEETAALVTKEMIEKCYKYHVEISNKDLTNTYDKLKEVQKKILELDIENRYNTLKSFVKDFKDEAEKNNYKVDSKFYDICECIEFNIIAYSVFLKSILDERVNGINAAIEECTKKIIRASGKWRMIWTAFEGQELDKDKINQIYDWLSRAIEEERAALKTLKQEVADKRSNR